MPTIANSNDATQREIVALRDGAINVDTYGAVGDGSTNDNDAIDSAITAAGVNGTLIFSAGSTYVVDRVLIPLQGQTWIGYGATLKRADRVATLLTGAPTGAVFPVTPGEGTNFRIGSTVALWDTPDETDHSSNIRDVTAVSANSVTLTGSFTGITAATGDQLETANQLINSTAADIQILGFTINGNGTSYSSGLHAWQLHTDIRLEGARSRIKDCVLTDAQLEAIIISGDGTNVVHNAIVSPGGNAVHLSASDGLLVAENYMFNSQVYNNDSLNHQDGAISVSNDVVNCSIIGNYYDGNSNGLSFVGGCDETTEQLIVVGNHALNTTVGAVSATGAFGSVSSGYLISGNIFDNCTEFVFNDTTGNKRVEDVTISNNYIVATEFTLDNVDGFTISNNTIDVSTGSISGNLITILDSSNGSFAGNTVKAAALGQTFVLDSGGAGLLTNIKVTGNVFQGHTGTSNHFAVLARGNEASGIAITDNTIVSGTNANNVFGLMIRADGCDVSGNYIDWSGTTGGTNYAVHFDGSFVTNAGGSFRNNHVLHSELPIWIETGFDQLSIIGNHFESTGASQWCDIYADGHHIAGNMFKGCDVSIHGTDNNVVGNTVNGGTLTLQSTADTNYVNGNRVEGTGENITIASGATGNVVTNNATTAAITDSGTSTVTTSQNHTL